MEKFEYKPIGVCSTNMIFDIDGDIVKNIRIINGCPGNTLGISYLCKEQKIDYIIDKLKGIKCGMKETSCPDQLAHALENYKKLKNMN